MKNRRKKRILHGLQFQVVIAILGLIIGISIILVTSLFLIFKSNMSTVAIPSDVAQEIMYNSIIPVIIIGIVLFALSFWALVIISHKIYGPLYRLRESIQKLCSGEPTDELIFRRGDAINGLREIYNDLRKNLENTLQYDYVEMVRIFSDLENILDKVYNKNISNKEIYSALQQTCNRLAKALDMTSATIEQEEK